MTEQEGAEARASMEDEGFLTVLKRGARCAAQWVAANPHHLAAWVFALAAGATLGLAAARSPVATGLAYTLILLAYLMASKRAHRIPLIFALGGIQYTALAKAASEKLVLPLVVVERGPIGSSLYPDIVQIIAAYELVGTLIDCGKQYKPPENREMPTVPR